MYMFGMTALWCCATGRQAVLNLAACGFPDDDEELPAKASAVKEPEDGVHIAVFEHMGEEDRKILKVRSCHCPDWKCETNVAHDDQYPAINQHVQYNEWTTASAAGSGQQHACCFAVPAVANPG